MFEIPKTIGDIYIYKIMSLILRRKTDEGIVFFSFLFFVFRHSRRFHLNSDINDKRGYGVVTGKSTSSLIVLQLLKRRQK